MIIVNEECEYIVKNIKAVNALLESYELSKERVPVWLSKQLKRNIEKRINEISLNEEIKWLVEEDEEEVNITPNKYYDDDHDFGLFYGIESINWEGLTAENDEESVFAYLFYHLPDKKPKYMKQKIINWETKLLELTENSKPYLLEKYHVLSNKGYLVVYYLADILNLELLGNDPEAVIQKTVDSLFQLVEDTHDLLVSI